MTSIRNFTAFRCVTFTSAATLFGGVVLSLTAVLLKLSSAAKDCSGMVFVGLQDFFDGMYEKFVLDNEDSCNRKLPLLGKPF